MQNVLSLEYFTSSFALQDSQFVFVLTIYSTYFLHAVYHNNLIKSQIKHNTNLIEIALFNYEIFLILNWHLWMAGLFLTVNPDVGTGTNKTL